MPYVSRVTTEITCPICGEITVFFHAEGPSSLAGVKTCCVHAKSYTQNGAEINVEFLPLHSTYRLRIPALSTVWIVVEADSEDDAIARAVSKINSHRVDYSDRSAWEVEKINSGNTGESHE